MSPKKEAFNPGHKRKDPPAGKSGSRDSITKRARTGNFQRRDIPTQPAVAGLDSATGAMNVAAFVSAREYEIKALEKSMQRDRKGLSQRAFQQVPRSMRRRGASHNTKKVPKRLQQRATREMKEDNTPTVNAKTRPKSRLTRIRMEKAKKLVGINQRIRALERRKKTEKEGVLDPENMVDLSRAPKVKKNKLAEAPKATAKFKKRQVHKTWLPTHLWHAKRAHMTRPTEPLWRMAIPLEPTEKSYRPTHRAGGGRGAIASDMSYMATISCSGEEAALEQLLQDIAFGDDCAIDVWGKKGDKWKYGTRALSSWISNSLQNKELIGPSTVMWCPKTIPNHNESEVVMEAEGKLASQRKIFIRIHPAAFQQTWVLVLTVVKEKKLAISVEDLRFEIGSIDITGPASTEALQGVLKSATSSVAATTWSKLEGVTNPAVLPLGSILVLDVLDPRLHNLPEKPKLVDQDIETETLLAELLATWPLDQALSQSGLFSNEARYSASRSLPSQKSIDRRRTEAGPGKVPESKDTDPKIPILLLASRSSQNVSNRQGTWTVLLPWKCVDVIWRRLLSYPLSSGSTPRFSGLKQQQQLAFEKLEPWFPGDFPGTEAGKAWNRTEDENRKKNWERKPPSRRVNWESVDLGNNEKGELGLGWSCDWSYLFNDPKESSDHIGPGPASTDPAEPAPLKTRNESTTDVERAGAIKLYRQVPRKVADILLSRQVPNINSESVGLPHLVTIRLRYLTRGTPNPAARIYCLASLKDRPDLREKWIATSGGAQSSTKQSMKKERSNHGGDVKNHRVYPTENIEDFHVPGYDPAWDDEKKSKNARLRSKNNKEPNAASRAELAASLLQNDELKTIEYPQCPSKEHLVGFVTGGAYNLAEGRGTAIGSMWLEKLLEMWDDDLKAAGTDSRRLKKLEQEKKMVIVRNAGETVGRLAAWELV